MVAYVLTHVMNSFLQVKVGDQLSNQLSTTDTGYAPPVLVLYEGEGAKDAITQELDEMRENLQQASAIKAVAVVKPN